MGGALLVGQLVFRKNGIQKLMGAQLSLPDAVWRKVNYSWIVFFAFMGVLNLWVAFNFTTDTWVNFKLFGGMGLMLVFVMAQAVYLGQTRQGRAMMPLPVAPPLRVHAAPTSRNSCASA